MSDHQQDRLSTSRVTFEADRAPLVHQFQEEWQLLPSCRAGAYRLGHARAAGSTVHQPDQERNRADDFEGTRRPSRADQACLGDRHLSRRDQWCVVLVLISFKADVAMFLSIAETTFFILLHHRRHRRFFFELHFCHVRPPPTPSPACLSRPPARVRSRDAQTTRGVHSQAPSALYGRHHVQSRV